MDSVAIRVVIWDLPITTSEALFVKQTPRRRRLRGWFMSQYRAQQQPTAAKHYCSAHAHKTLLFRYLLCDAISLCCQCSDFYSAVFIISGQLLDVFKGMIHSWSCLSWAVRLSPESLDMYGRIFAVCRTFWKLRPQEKLFMFLALFQFCFPCSFSVRISYNFLLHFTRFCGFNRSPARVLVMLSHTGIVHSTQMIWW